MKLFETVEEYMDPNHPVRVQMREMGWENVTAGPFDAWVRDTVLLYEYRVWGLAEKLLPQEGDSASSDAVHQAVVKAVLLLSQQQREMFPERTTRRHDVEAAERREIEELMQRVIERALAAEAAS